MVTNLGIKVYQYDLNGDFIAEYRNIREAEFITKTNNIFLAINNKKNMLSAGGYIWSHTYYIKLPKNIIDKYENKRFIIYNTTIYEYDLEGNLINEYSSLSKITSKRAERNNIRAVLKGENKTFQNKIYKFEKYKKLPKLILKEHINKWAGFIVQYDLNHKKIKEWSSAYQASITLNIPRTNINRCLKGTTKQGSGYIWKYKE
jgi:hypothetical protein